MIRLGTVALLLAALLAPGQASAQAAATEVKAPELREAAPVREAPAIEPAKEADRPREPTKEAEPAAARTDLRAPDKPRVHASHRVDVIGPGEKVESIIDRMRGLRPVPEAGDSKGKQRLPLRQPDRRPGPDRWMPEAQKGPPTGPEGFPPPFREGPPPDRPRR